MSLGINGIGIPDCGAQVTHGGIPKFGKRHGIQTDTNRSCFTYINNLPRFCKPANPINFSGSCPAQINFTYTVTTGSDGLVNYRLILTTISPSGYVFDPPLQYSQSVAGATTLSLPYLLISSSSVVATARVQAVGSNTFTSPPLRIWRRKP